MAILNIIFRNLTADELILTKSENNAISEIRAGRPEYIRCFLWHPNFVYVKLFGDSRTARLKVDVMDEVIVDIETSEWIFAFPMKIDNDNQMFVTNHDIYHQLDIDSGTYYVVVHAKKLTSEEIESDPELMGVYCEVGMPLDVEIPYEYRILFCRSNHLKEPKIFRVSDSLRKIQAILRERGRPQDLENINFYDEIYVLNSDYEPVLLEDSKYEFLDEVD
ncbi:MAG: hypothetical protein F6K00_23265 [Leptolyngbya sp. SIOISBB]|nr:hypothetical protein [Leptolyngbya sp. SIOISBB]